MSTSTEEAIQLLEEIRDELFMWRGHSCAGADCSTCSPNGLAERIDDVITLLEQ